MTVLEPDNCDAPTKSQIYVGLGWTAQIISNACRELHDLEPRLALAGEALTAASENQRMIGVKLASEAAHEAAMQAELLIKTIKMESAVLARKAAEHLNRRSRI